MRRGLAGVVCVAYGCSEGGVLRFQDASLVDAAVLDGADTDLAEPDDLAGPDLVFPPNGCGNYDPACNEALYGALDEPFPTMLPQGLLDGVRLDREGNLVLDGSDRGTYALVVTGCTDINGIAGDTAWWQASWDADLPPGASITVRAQAADLNDAADPRWAGSPATSPVSASPLRLRDNLSPNSTSEDPCPIEELQNSHLRLQLFFSAGDNGATPKIRSLRAGFDCACSWPL